MSGHAFVRPGQVAPHLPAPDNCVTCGLSEAAHRIEIAEVISGKAILADFQRAAHEFTVGTLVAADWLTWALRVSQHLQLLIDAVSQPEPAAPVVALGGSYVAGDGSAWLSADDVATVRLALFHAARGAALADSAAYDGLAWRLGDDR